MKVPPFQIYVAHALTDASPRFKEETNLLRATIATQRPEWNILQFYGLGASPSDGLIAKTDFSQVFRADLVCAIADESSIGMGEEAGFRMAFGLPIVFFGHVSWKRTRMVTGPAELWPEHVLFHRYERIEDCVPMIAQALKHFAIDPTVPKPSRLVVPDHIQALYQEANGIHPLAGINTAYMNEGEGYQHGMKPPIVAP